MKSFYDHLIDHGPLPQNYTPAGKLTLEGAFEIYRQGYQARLTDTLGDTFELVWKVLGDDIFFQVAREFIYQNVSENYNLSNYSANFITYLSEHKISQEFPFLKDLAQLGWDQKEVFDAPREKGLESSDLLALLESENGTGAFVSSLRMRSSPFCIFDIWNALRTGASPPENWEQSQAVAVYKSEDQVFLKHIPLKNYLALRRMETGEALLAACENLEEKEISSLFRFLTKDSLIKKRD